MAKYKIVFDGEVWEEDIYDTYEEAEAGALELCSCERLGAEIMHMSNPGDYDYEEDDWEDSDYEIIEVEE